MNVRLTVTLFWYKPPVFGICYGNCPWNLLVNIRKTWFTVIIKLEGLYQNKVNSSLASIHTYKMTYSTSEKRTWATDQMKTKNWSADNFKKCVTSMCCIPEPMIQSCDTGQQMPFLDNCQLTITRMSNTRWTQKVYALDSLLVNVPFHIILLTRCSAELRYQALINGNSNSSVKLILDFIFSPLTPCETLMW